MRVQKKSIIVTMGQKVVAGIIGRMFDELDSFEQPSTIVVDVIGIGSGVVANLAR